MTPQQGMVFDVQRFSLHDGTGIRTIVFLKGCPLNCMWCSNPESKKQGTQLLIWPDKCIGCKSCVSRCPAGALSWDDGAGIHVDRVMCTNCGECCEMCYADALVMRGSRVTVDKILNEVLRDKVFYNLSGGGLTLSGGEPLAQPEFAEELLRKVKDAGFSTAIETSGYAPEETLERVDPYIDTYLFDVKHLAPEKHKEYTGVENTQILGNLEWLVSKGSNVIIRVPVIPGFNDDKKSLQDIVDLAKKLGIKRMSFLPYHEYGRNKYSALGLEYGYSDASGRVGLDMDQFSQTKESLDYGGINVSVGG